MFKNTSSLIKQIKLGEDSVFELKEIKFNGKKITYPHKGIIADELAAMANTVSGVFLFGVNDKTKKIEGIPSQKIDIVETWLRAICNDLIEPPLDCIIRKLGLIDKKGTKKNILRVDVARSLFVHKSPNGYFKRIGSSKREMKPDVLARLFQQRSQVRLNSILTIFAANAPFKLN